ncbi:hypothetical protein [Longivirga aurantiaca]|uniref:DUF4013 domain-containing protein n=1 Tax=Longivirga aurantiaca TaxID=1837743 RepID=A0ABW1T2Q9_9ACTN
MTTISESTQLLPTGETRRQVAREYGLRVLLPGLGALLLVPMFGPVSVVLDWIVYSILWDTYGLAKTVSNWVMLADLVVGGALAIYALVSTVRLGRVHRGDRLHHADNRAGAWHVGSVVLLVVLMLVPVALVLLAFALAMTFSMMNSGL